MSDKSLKYSISVHFVSWEQLDPFQLLKIFKRRMLFQVSGGFHSEFCARQMPYLGKECIEYASLILFWQTGVGFQSNGLFLVHVAIYFILLKWDENRLQHSFYFTTKAPNQMSWRASTLKWKESLREKQSSVLLIKEKYLAIVLLFNAFWVRIYLLEIMRCNYWKRLCCLTNLVLKPGHKICVKGFKEHAFWYSNPTPEFLC